MSEELARSASRAALPRSGPHDHTHITTLDNVGAHYFVR